MQDLHVAEFGVRDNAIEDHRYCDNLALEYIPSLRQINVMIVYGRDARDKVNAALRRTAQVHPNRPTICI